MYRLSVCSHPAARTYRNRKVMIAEGSQRFILGKLMLAHVPRMLNAADSERSEDKAHLAKNKFKIKNNEAMNVEY